MRRHGNLWKDIVSWENIQLAYQKAKKGKSKYSQVKKIEENPDFYLRKLQKSLIEKTFTTSRYRIKTIHRPKKRDIYILPFYPDRIVQHAIMNQLEPIWNNMFIHDSYACRIGKGQHKASQRIMEFIRKSKARYYFQGDIRKFYPSINHNILKKIIRKKIKDPDTLDLLDNIIDSIDGDINVPIGNYTSQWLGNLYLNELDQYVKNELKCNYYLRYNDDFIIIHDDIYFLKEIESKIRIFLRNKLDLTLSKEKIQPINNSIIFVGYKHFYNKILLRKSTKLRIFRNIKYKFSRFYRYPEGHIISSIASLKGWIKWCNDTKFRNKFNSIIGEYNETVPKST